MKKIPDKNELQKLKHKIRSLQDVIKSRDAEIKRLRSETKTFKKALDQSGAYIDDRLEGVPIERIVKFFSNRKQGSLDDLKDEHEQYLTEQHEKWQCYKCNEGYMRLLKIGRPDGLYYFRACSTKCGNKTKLQKYHDDVEGIE